MKLIMISKASKYLALFSLVYLSTGCSYIPFCELMPTYNYSGLQAPSDYPSELKISCSKLEQRESILSYSGNLEGQKTTWHVYQNVDKVESFIAKAIQEPKYLIIQQDLRSVIAKQGEFKYEVKIEPIDDKNTRLTVNYVRNNL